MNRWLVILFILIICPNLAQAACGANTRTWQPNAGTPNWNTNNNWSPANRPNTATENAVIISDWFTPNWPNNNYTLGCVEIQSGNLSATNNRQLTIVGDYFRNLNAGSLSVGGANTWEVIMQGTADQTFENVDLIPRLRINNANTVTLTESFTIRDRFLIDSGTGFVVIEGSLTTQQTGLMTINSGTDVTIAAGGAWVLSGSLQIDGTLHVEPGSQLILADGASLTIGASGSFDINGASGNAVSISAEDSTSTFSFVVTGQLDAQYLILNYMDSFGVQMNGNVTRFNNVSINAIPSSGAGLTIGAAANLTSGMDGVGFFDNGTAGPFTNVDASVYSGSTVDFADWSGLGDTANENDPNTVINWGTEADVVLQVQNVSGAGIPPSTIVKGSGSTQFATFAFSMSGTAAAATNVTSITFTLDGSNINSDVSTVAVYDDTNGNCSYDGGTDTLIGNYTPTGTPGTFDVTLSGEINVVDTTQDCLHIFMSTAASATTDNTIGISIESTDDVTNDLAYALSDTTGPPVNPGLATITGTAIYKWNGGFSNNMFTTGNWTPNGNPNSGTDCEVGSGYQPPRMTATFSCQNTRFQYSGTINWNNTSNAFNVYGAWIVENGFVYSNSNNAVVNIVGAGDQSVSLDGTTFPNDVTVNSGGVVTFEDSGVISGNLTLSGGTIRIANGASLQVSGNISVASGTTFDIEPGGELILGNGSTLTVSSGGTLEIVGNSSLAASVKAVNDSSNYTITINNGASISAQYYSLRNLGTNGLTVNASATIDGTNFLQNGTFIYPGINNANLLRLFQEIPGDNLDGMSFSADSSGATGVISIYTSTGATSDTLSMTNYSGDLTGSSYTNDNNYLVSWDSETNELKLTQQSTAPASSNQGDVVDMGTFGFQQLNAGSFSDTDITYIRVTLTGTGSSTDVDSVSLYYDSGCSGSGGTLIGTKTFSGSPARAEFTSITGATVEADVASPPLRCFNVEYSIDSLATDGKTVGAEISSSTHVTNSQAYDFNASFAPPVDLGTTSIVGVTTQWTGAVNTDWFTAGNWSSGVPTSGLNCIINDQANDPVISAGTATCKSMSIGNGILTHSGGTLQLYGSLESTGTITSSSTILIRDDGATPTSQNIDVTSTLSTLQFNKTAGGSVSINSDVDVTNALAISGGQNFTLNITIIIELIANAGLTISGGVVDMAGGSELQIGSGQSLTVNGGTFRTSGTNDAYPQTLSTKAHITNTGGSSTWSFVASSGTVDLTGFYIDWLDTGGLNFSGTVSLSSLDGGQLRNLPNSAGMRALQFNTTGSIPATSSNFGWNWGPTNSPPSEATSYYLGYSSGCSSQTIDFDQWFGDFWPFTTASTTDKISATSCTILIDRAKSPVSLTRLEATPYDSKVLIEWTTGNEWNHRGFNVYRSLNPDDSFVQINNELIRNDLFSTNIHGTYAFIDEGVVNGETYYYMLEDIALMGESAIHGPLVATPDATLGDPPIIQAGTIASNSNQNGDGGSDSSGGDVVEISENVWVLAQTDNYMRIKIVIPTMTQANDPLNTSYQKLSIDGYSPSTEPGRPELLNKTIMIPLGESASTVTWKSVSEITANFPGVQVTPAPEYSAVGNTMVPNWILDSGFYGTNQILPNSHIELSSVVQLGGKYFQPLVVHALKYNPVTQDLVKADEIILDLNLQGTAPWDTIDTSITPWMREGTIKLGLLAEEGMYQVSFDDLQAAGVVAPLENQDISHIHLQIASSPVGLDIDSADSLFNSGDVIKFYSPQLKSDEDLHTYAALYVDSSESSLQANNVDVSISGEPAAATPGFWTKKLYEENNIAIFNEPFTEQTDHFVWSMIYGVSGGANSPLAFDIDLPYLSSEGSVTIKALVKSRTANAVNTLHNLELYINEQSQLADEKDFQAEESTWVRFNIPTSAFAPGKNKIQLVATGDNLTPGEYDMLYVDRVETYFHQEWIVQNDEALVLSQPQGYSYNIGGFSGSDVEIYDVSSPSQLNRFINFGVGADSYGEYVEFALNGISPGRRLWLGRPTQLKSVDSYKLISGSHWRDQDHQADVVYIGHRDLLQVVRSLGDLRESQGYKIEYVELESIYNEFGNGLANVSAIKDFFETSRQWNLAPRYYILLGDGTYDPKAYQNSFLKYRFPVKYIKGSSYDYVSDHWFVSNDDGIPQAVVGRIPAKSATELETYVQKVLNYESGVSKPSTTAPIQMISDKPLYTGEDFEKPISDLQSLNEVQTLTNEKIHIKRSELTDNELKQSIVAAFNNSSVIHYMGHGAENIWADTSVFTNNDVQNLSNQKLPIVVAMNCLNAQFSDPDLDSFAEEMIFNPQGGAIAFWGSTSFTPPSIQNIYQKSFYKNMSSGHYDNLGDLVKFAKVEAGLSSPFDEILYSWSILGDPMVQPGLSFKTEENPTTEIREPSAAPSSGGGGCSAFASDRIPQGQTPWALILSFLIEVLITIGTMRLLHFMATKVFSH